MFINRLDQPHMTNLIRMSWVWRVGCTAVLSQVFGSVDTVLAQATNDPIISLQVSGLDATEPWTFGLRILFMLTMLTLAPALLMLVTSFTRVVIVLGLLRQALGTLHAPEPSHDRVSLILDALHHDAGLGKSPIRSAEPVS